MSNGSVNFRKFLECLAFIAIVAVAVALIIKAIAGAGDLANALDIVAKCIAYLVTSIYAFYFVYQKRNPVYIIVYAVAVIVIVILLII